MKYILFLVFSLFTFFVKAQETKKVTIKKDGDKEIFYVLKSDKNIRHGLYEKRGYKDELEIQGFYKNGEKDSVWIEYLYDGNMLSKGTYYKGNKVGIWNYYKGNNKIDFSYNYDSLKLTYFDPSYDIPYEVYTNNDTLTTKLDSPPIYKGGLNALYHVVGMNAMYTSKAHEKRTQGKVMVSFIINTDGLLSDFKVESGLGDGLDEESIRIAKLIPADFTIPILNGEKVKVKYIFPIVWKLN